MFFRHARLCAIIYLSRIVVSSVNRPVRAVSQSIICKCSRSIINKSSLYCAKMDAKTISSSIAKFSARFCNELDKTKNVVSSPLSAELVLALLTLGTDEPAHPELLNSLGIANDDAIRSSFSLVASKLRAIRGVTFDIANKVYIKEGGYKLHPELKEDAVKVFDAAFELIDFNEGVEAARTINKWVESKTNGKIKNLLSDDSLNADTRVVFVNALYFKGMWKNKFDVKDTLELPFHLDKEETINIPMMYKEDSFKYGQSRALDAQLLQMFYEGDEASMLVVLPREVTGLDGVLQKLAEGHDLLAEVSQMYQTKVEVTLPKFKIETKIDLKILLPKLGINAIFSKFNSGLTKILDNDEPLVVSEAVQKAFIEVNEEGAEAAAATAMIVSYITSVTFEPPVPTFKADRPFLVAILISDTVCFVATHRGSV